MYPAGQNFVSATQYTEKWLSWTAAIDKAVNDAAKRKGLTFPTRRWLVASNTARGLNPALDPKDIIAAGIDRNQQVAEYSVHAYSASACTAAKAQNATVQVLLDMDYTRNFAKSRIAPSLSTLQSGQGGSRKWIMGEGNSVSCEGKLGVSDTLAQALYLTGWSLSYAVFGASGVYMHNGATLLRKAPDGSVVNQPTSDKTPAYSTYSFVYPTASTARGKQRATPGYVSQLLLTEAIGSSGRSRAVFLTPPSGVASKDFFGVAIYDDAIPGGMGPARLVLINSKPYLRGSSAPRGRVDFTYSSMYNASNVAARTTYVKRLSGPYANEQESAYIKWANQSYKFADPSGTRVVEKLTNGTVAVADSEAVLIYLRGTPF